MVSYTYDAWGKVLSVTDTSNINLGMLNPMRYRDYYLDVETGYYYLQSRYYNPEFCRFINADEVSITIFFGDAVYFNLFIYCDNNPIMYDDPTGYEAISITLAIILNAVGWVLQATLLVVAGILIISVAVYKIIKIIKTLKKYIKGKKDKALAASLATLVGFTTAASPPPPNDPKFRGAKTKGSVKLYEKGKVRVEVENMGNNTGNVHLQIKGDPNKYYYNPKDMQFYKNKSYTKLAPNSIQDYLNDKKIVDAIIKGLKNI